MATYRVLPGCEGYINDRMETEGNLFDARDGLTGSWFESVDAAAEAVSEIDSEPEFEVEAQADAAEDAASEDEGTRPDPALAEAEVAAGEPGEDDGVEVL